MTYEIKKELPPNFDDIVKVFPVVAEAKDRVVFSYFPHIYMPGGQELPPDLYVHESIHMKQQENYEGGVTKWWVDYLEDRDFRLSQELEAYGAQLAMFNELPNRVFERVKDRLASDLASEYYGKLISYGMAAAKIRRIAKSITHEKNTD